MKNNLIKINILFFELVLLYIILNFNIGCLFKKIFGICCPGCGMTRAFLSIFNFDFVSAFKCNIISIPLFLFIVLINFLLVYDIIFGKNRVYSFLKLMSKKYILILCLVIIAMVINNVNKI